MDTRKPVKKLRNNSGLISGGYDGDKMYSVECNQCGTTTRTYTMLTFYGHKIFTMYECYFV